MAACACHSVPLDGSRRTGALLGDAGGPPRGRRCPLSHLDLDQRDVQQIGFVGQFCGPQFTGSTELEGGVTVPADEDAVCAPHLVLDLVSRVPLRDVAFSSVFGHPWALAAAADSLDEADHRAVCAIAARLHESNEGLLCRAVTWRNFRVAAHVRTHLHSLSFCPSPTR